ncbi:hypothetical protein D3C74_469230 [compost metagenome]
MNYLIEDEICIYEMVNSKTLTETEKEVFEFAYRLGKSRGIDNATNEYELRGWG